MNMTIDTMIENYVKLRDKKKAVEDKHKAELAPFKETMDQLEGWLLEAMNTTGTESVRTPHGTAFKSMRTSAVVRDWQATLGFIRSHEAWHLLEARVSKTAAFAVIKETKEPIPGVETSQEVGVNVRRAGEKPAAN